MLGVAVLLWLMPQAYGAETTLRSVRFDMSAVRSLQKPLPAPKEGDWRYERSEPGQTFAEYRAQVRTYGPVATRTRRYLYVWPLGTFSDAQQKVVKKTCSFLGLYYAVPVRVLATTSLKSLAESARVKRLGQAPQVDADYILDKILAPRLPADAVAMVAITSEDLHPNKGWNLRYAFGMSQIYKRVSVASMYRLGDPMQNRKEYHDCLLRTMKIVSHEVGHTLLMQHCTGCLCNMNGLNNRMECDRAPLWLCAECAGKICWALQADPLARYTQLAAFCKANALQAEETYFTKAATQIQSSRQRQLRLRAQTSRTSSASRQNPMAPTPATFSR